MGQRLRDMVKGMTVDQVMLRIDHNILGQKNRQILRRMLVDGMTYEQVAEQVDMSVRGVQYRVEKIKHYLN